MSKGTIKILKNQIAQLQSAIKSNKENRRKKKVSLLSVEANLQVSRIEIVKDNTLIEAQESAVKLLLELIDSLEKD